MDRMKQENQRSTRVSLGRDSTSAACVQAVRASIAASFPSIDIDEVLAITRSFELCRLPDSLLVAGEVDDTSAAGLRSNLTAAAETEVRSGSDPHPLFSRSYYDFRYPSVAAEGLSAWAHYHRWGVPDALSPHFLIDVDYLAQSLPGVRRNQLIDQYLDHPRWWFVGPGPYVEMERFILSGGWDGTTHPLAQIVTNRREWLLPRLMLVDSAWGSTQVSKMNGAAFLLASSSPASVVAPLAAWEEDPSESESHSDKADIHITVVPGFVVCADQRVLRILVDDAISADRSMIRIPGGAMSLVVGPQVTTSLLVVMAGPGARADLEAVVDRCPADGVIAPFDTGQEYALKHEISLRSSTVRVLRAGRQAHVLAVRLHFDTPALPPEIEWTYVDEANPRDLVIVVPQAEGIRDPDPTLTHLVSLGATLCIVASSRVSDWAAQIERGPVVVAHRRLLGAVRTLSPSPVTVLPDFLWW